MRKIFFGLFLITLTVGFWVPLLLSQYPIPDLPEPFDTLVVFVVFGLLFSLYGFLVIRIKKRILH